MARKRRIKLLKIEKLMLILCFTITLLFPVSDVFGKAMLSKSNIEAERLKKQIQIQQNKNQSLTMKVNELQSFENIQAVASEQGLAYNSNNVKVIGNN